MPTMFLYPIILVAGVLQAWGPPMNGALRRAVVNPWLASLASFLPVIALLGVLALCLPRPLPTGSDLASMPWWAPLGGLIGSVAVVAGLLFVTRVGAGPFAALTISANLLMSVLIDQFGLFGMPQHAIGLGRAAGAAPLVAGVTLIAAF